MPTYSFRNKDTNEVTTEFLTLKEREQFLQDNPNFDQLLTAPAYADSVRLGVRKIDRSFNDVLIKAKKAHLHSTIDTL